MHHHEIHLTIGNCLRSYCRGIDRLDGPLIASAFHPDAELIDYGPAPLRIEDFIEHAVASLGKRFVATQHRLSNVTIEIDESSSSAKVEAYVLAFHVQANGETQLLHTFNGRYIDQFDSRSGEWKIARRTLRNDWSKIETIDAPMAGAWVPSGRAGSPDPLD